MWAAGPPHNGGVPTPTQPERAATIYDVARVTGVSPSTVSRTFARPGQVRYATVERIRAAAEEVGYHSEVIHRPIAPSAIRRGTIALVIADISNPVFFELIRGAEEEAAQNGYLLLLAHTRESGVIEREALDRSADMVDGVILSSTRMSDSAVRTMARQKPTVIINRVVTGVPSIYVDHVGAAHQVMTHLQVLGHTRVLYVAGPAASWANGMRWQAIKDYAAVNGISVTSIQAPAPTMDGGAALAEQVRRLAPGAIVAFNDLIALGLIKSLRGHGLRTPGDYSIVGFDNSSGADLVDPGLTSIASPQYTLGATAVRTLLALSAHGAARPTQDHSVKIPSRLVVRGSTGTA